jgi:hypothetical protein
MLVCLGCFDFLGIMGRIFRFRVSGGILLGISLLTMGGGLGMS